MTGRGVSVSPVITMVKISVICVKTDPVRRSGDPVRRLKNENLSKKCPKIIIIRANKAIFWSRFYYIEDTKIMGMILKNPAEPILGF